MAQSAGVSKCALSDATRRESALRDAAGGARISRPHTSRALLHQPPPARDTSRVARQWAAEREPRAPSERAATEPNENEASAADRTRVAGQSGEWRAEQSGEPPVARPL